MKTIIEQDDVEYHNDGDDMVSLLPVAFDSNANERVPDDELITINISGEYFETFRETLDRFPNTLLGDPVRRGKYRIPNGELFFDRYSDAFEAILYYYQSDGMLYLPDELPARCFIADLKFFDLGDSVIEEFEIECGIKEREITSNKPNHFLWEFLEYPETSFAAKTFALVSVVVILVSLVLLVVETLPEFSTTVTKTSITTDSNERNRTIYTLKEIPSKHEYWMFITSTIVFAWFSAEFVLRLITCPDKLDFFLSIGNVIDFISVLPYFMTMVLSLNNTRGPSVLRAVRILRVFKLSRHSSYLRILGRTITAAREELGIQFVFFSVQVLLCGRRGKFSW